MYFIFRKKFCVSDIVFTANSFAHLSIPFAPPEMISVVSFGIYFQGF